MDNSHQLRVWKFEMIHPIEDVLQNLTNTFSENTVYTVDASNYNLSLIETIVYDSLKYHVGQLDHNILDCTIEFQYKHIDASDSTCSCSYGTKSVPTDAPVITCIIHLTESPTHVTFVTNINSTAYKYKQFDDQTEFILSHPVPNKQITFTGDRTYGTNSINVSSDISDCGDYYAIYATARKVPSTVSSVHERQNDTTIYQSDQLLLSIAPAPDPVVIQIDADMFNYKLFNDLLYMNIPNTCFALLDTNLTTKLETPNSTFCIVPNNSPDCHKGDTSDYDNENNYNDIVSALKNISSNDFLFTCNRFIQRFAYPDVYTSATCEYIINESNKYADTNGGWMTQRHEKYPTTDLPVKDIPNIIDVVFRSMKDVLDLIVNSYQLHDDVKLNITDLFIVKYQHDKQASLKRHCDKSHISFNILLSDETDFEGGGTHFDDGITMKSKRGGIIIHSGQLYHSGIKITSGSRYLLTGFVDILI